MMSSSDLDRSAGGTGKPSPRSRFAPYLFERDEHWFLFGLRSHETSWRGVVMLAALFFGSLAAVVFLTPFVYHLLEIWSRTGSTWAQSFLQKGDARFVSGLRWIVILACLPLVLRACRLTSLKGLGLPPGLDHLRVWTAWMAIGLALVAAMGALQIWAGVVGPRLPAPQLWKDLPLRFLQGFVGGIGEEVIFRGLVVAAFYTATGRPWLALVLSALFFAYTHFKVPDIAWQAAGRLDRADVGWFVAYWSLFGIVGGFDPAKFFALFALGLALGVLALRAGTLWPAIGLHAGLVMGVLIYKGRYDAVAGTDNTFWGGPGLVDGWAAITALIALTILVLFRRKRDNSQS